MAYQIPTACPACSEPMMVTELTCDNCNTKVNGSFQLSGLHNLNAEQLQFAEVFLRCRGNIKEVERELGISYPTVRSRLDQVITTMGYPVQNQYEETASEKAASVLDRLESGDLSFDEALKRLKEDRLSK